MFERRGKDKPTLTVPTYGPIHCSLVRTNPSRFAFALLALSLLPGLALGRTGILPCPHMAMGTEQPVDADEAAHHHHGNSSKPPLGHTPCTCAAGCPGASAVESAPAARVSFTPLHLQTAPDAPPVLETHLPLPSPYLLPFPLPPPSSL
jgi:hypothetical protein